MCPCNTILQCRTNSHHLLHIISPAAEKPTQGLGQARLHIQPGTILAYRHRHRQPASCVWIAQFEQRMTGAARAPYILIRLRAIQFEQ
jgi:hypothetical protein